MVSERYCPGMVNTRMEGRVDGLERAMEEVQRWQKVEGERLNRMETTLQRVTDERLAGIERTLNRLLDRLERRRSPTPEGEGRRNGDHQGGDDESQGEGEGGGQPEGAKHRKLELPIFEGEDPLGWIFRVERYFTVNGVTEAERLDAAVVSLEGKALAWFQWMEARTPVRSWQEFKTEVTERFHCKQIGDEYEQLMALRQLGTVDEFREQFEAMSV